MAATSTEDVLRSPRYSRRVVPAQRPVPGLAEDVAAGFAREPRRLAPKYFYDDHGSRLFDRICDTPEYYPTRTEQALIADSAAALVTSLRPDHIIELGAGTARKTEALFSACDGLGIAPRYWPFDVCESIMQAAAERMLPRYPWLSIDVLVGDYSAGLGGLPRPAGRCLYVFLGGTLGNFEPAESEAFLGELAARMAPEDRLLLGVDRVKDRGVLEAAYNDAEGWTAAFNRNVLTVLNRELGADFDVDAFRHEAFFNESASRIEMHLVAGREQRVTVPALATSYRFAAGERLHTEISRKFTPAGLEAELGHAGLTRVDHFEPEDGAFSLLVAAPARAG